jgi:hypothetical protein
LFLRRRRTFFEQASQRQSDDDFPQGSLSHIHSRITSFSSDAIVRSIVNMKSQKAYRKRPASETEDCKAPPAAFGTAILRQQADSSFAKEPEQRRQIHYEEAATPHQALNASSKRSLPLNKPSP